ncbi:MAG: hypothetical protein ACJAYB_000103 [Psychromonas sp.]|jgi:hypothetical protein
MAISDTQLIGNIAATILSGESINLQRPSSKHPVTWCLSDVIDQYGSDLLKSLLFQLAAEMYVDNAGLSVAILSGIEKAAQDLGECHLDELKDDESRGLINE